MTVFSNTSNDNSLASINFGVLTVAAHTFEHRHVNMMAIRLSYGSKLLIVTEHLSHVQQHCLSIRGRPPTNSTQRHTGGRQLGLAVTAVAVKHVCHRRNGGIRFVPVTSTLL